MIQVSLLLVVFGFLGLIMTLCTEGFAWWHFCFLRGKTTAQVVDEMSAAFEASKGAVLVQKEDGSFSPVEATMDRSVGHMPFYHRLFERGRVRYVLQWEAEGKCWQGNYRFLKKKGVWKVGDTVRLSFCPSKPWIYGVRDETLWRIFLGKCLAYITLTFLGILLLILAVP